GLASSLLLVTAHAARDASPRPLLEPRRTTLAVYMPGPDYARTAHELVQMGIDPDTPCAVVSNACRPGQRVHAISLGDLESGRDVPAPAVLIIGRVAQSHAAKRTELAGQECVAAEIAAVECPAQPSPSSPHPSC